ncbi:serine hydrolase [Streptomyces sp. ISL-100]|uniref:serine hydrolase n=1 Tax=Streptomyces sp. ISL-100 TaxID=2819173 RepID=UPI0035ABCE80
MAAATLLLTLGGALSIARQAEPETAPVSNTIRPPASQHAPSPASSSGPSMEEELATVVEDATAGTAGHLATAVMDLESGQSATAGDRRAFATASIVKVDILAALLLKAQDADRRLTAQERQWATVMIQASDNAAATALWDAIGGAEGLAKANRRLGLRETAPGPDGLWGLTETTAADQLRLLKAVFTDDSTLSDASRAYVQQLMGGVAEDQDWGISAAADDAESARLKNGWLSRSETGLWVINSIGLVERNGRRLLVAVLSDDQPDQAAGISLVETVADKATTLLSPA